MRLIIDLPWISVIIPTYGKVGVGLTDECIRSMRQTHSHLKIQIIVVDDGSPEADFNELLAVCQSYDGVEVVRNKVRSGFGKSCNTGLRLSNGICCFLVNNDITFEGSPALQILADTMNATNCGVVGTRLLYPDRRIQHAGVVFVPVKDQPIAGYWDHLLRFEQEYHHQAVCLRNTLVTGALMGINRNAIQMIGLLDERFGFAVEDIDYQLEVITAGLPVFFCGYPLAVHQEGKNRGRTIQEKMALAPEAWKAEQEGLVKFFEKWKGID